MPKRTNHDVAKERMEQSLARNGKAAAKCLERAMAQAQKKPEAKRAVARLKQAKEDVAWHKQMKKDCRDAEMASKAVKKAEKLMKRNKDCPKAQKAMNRALSLKQQAYQIKDKYERELDEIKMKDNQTQKDALHCDNRRRSPQSSNATTQSLLWRISK
jgi:hypothetical protein